MTILIFWHYKWLGYVSVETLSVGPSLPSCFLAVKCLTSKRSYTNRISNFIWDVSLVALTEVFSSYQNLNQCRNWYVNKSLISFRLLEDIPTKYDDHLPMTINSHDKRVELGNFLENELNRPMYSNLVVWNYSQQFKWHLLLSFTCHSRKDS